MSGMPPKPRPDRIPSVDRVLDLIELSKRYHYSSLRGFVLGMFDPVDHRVKPGDLSSCERYLVIDVFREMDLLLPQVRALLDHPDFLCPHNWSDRLRVRLSTLRHHIFTYDDHDVPELDTTSRWAIRYGPPGTLECGEAFDRLSSMGRSIIEFEAVLKADLERAAALADSLRTESPAGARDEAEAEHGSRQPVSKVDDFPSVGVDISVVVSQLRRAGRPMQAALVEYMADKPEATADEIAENVHGNAETKEDTIRKNMDRTNGSLESMKQRLRFRFASSRLYREIPVQ